MSFTERYNRIKEYADKTLNELVPSDIPSQLRQSMNYSLCGGGKRLRPVLFLSVLEAYGITPNADDIKAACAIECVHIYSLIHDDLPSMDNDDFRRGLPTNHKKFGEAIAVLAGDGLLNLAFELLSDLSAADGKYATVLREVAACAGVRGMIGGQALEFATDMKNADAETLEKITRLKTGKLIECALVGGCASAGKTEDIEKWREFATLFGRAFQLRDDMLDLDGGEYSLARLLGRGNAEKELRTLWSAAERVLNTIDCDSAFLRELSEAMLLREIDGL